MSAATSHSPYFDFESQVRSCDEGFVASDDCAFAFKPLARKFYEFRFFECSSHFFIFGTDADRKNVTLLEISRDQGKVDIGSTVTIPALADDSRFADCSGQIVGQVNATRWLVKVALSNGGSETMPLDSSSFVYDGLLKWCVQEFCNKNDFALRVKELSCHHPVGWHAHPNFDGIVGFARFTDDWYF
jgi:hypothetical protein